MNINKLLAKVFGSSNEREVKRLRPLVEQVNSFEDEVKKLSDEQLRRTTPDTVLLAVADDGVGDTGGAAPMKSLGLQLVSSLVEQLHGRLETTRQPGVTHRIAVPVEVADGR